MVHLFLWDDAEGWWWAGSLSRYDAGAVRALEAVGVAWLAW